MSAEMMYLIVGVAAISGILAAYRPTAWSMLAAGSLNAAAAWFAFNAYFQ
jgi:hypothetical protein